jgi:chemotaxis protein methyltransferase CheR
MTDDCRPVSLQVRVDAGTASSNDAGSIGYLVTELVINAFKHAFVGERAAGQLVVAYEVTDTGWRLAVSDNGIGTPQADPAPARTTSGLGTIIVEALAKQLGARVDTVTNSQGTTVSITHGSITHGSITHGSITHGSITHGSIDLGSATRATVAAP